MANNEGDIFRPTDEASIALLRSLRTKTIVDRCFIHRADVCSAAPEELIADLQPVPGTDVTEDGYNSIWYIYCPKRYKNTRGKAGGHRQRAVEPDGKTCWHSEIGPKPVQGVPGATFCNFSYGCKEKEGESARRSFTRMGWCLTEFDDTQDGGGDHVLCRVHRSSSSLAKRKFKSSSSSSKRKAAGEHPEAPPTKLIHDELEQMQVQQDPAAFFTMPCYGFGAPEDVDPAVTMVEGEEEERGMQQQQQQPRVELEAEHVDGGEFNVEELLNMEEFTNAYPTTTMPCDVHGGPQGVEPAMFGGEEEEHGLQLPCVELEAEHGGDMGGFNLEELLNTDDWKALLQMLQAEGEQGQQQPSAEPEQGGGIFISDPGDLLYAC